MQACDGDCGRSSHIGDLCIVGLPARPGEAPTPGVDWQGFSNVLCLDCFAARNPDLGSPEEIRATWKRRCKSAYHQAKGL